MLHVSYSNAVGSFIYAVVCTRPNISHAPSMVSRYLLCSGKVYWQTMKLIFEIFKGYF